MKKMQSGFTLVEIAIVLVIIGLLLGGVLKGQELVNNAKVKNLANDFRGISSFVYAYQDRFRALPGDDAAANTHLNGGTTAAPAVAANLGNARINGNWNSATATDKVTFSGSTSVSPDWPLVQPIPPPPITARATPKADLSV